MTFAIRTNPSYQLSASTIDLILSIIIFFYLLPSKVILESFLEPFI